MEHCFAGDVATYRFDTLSSFGNVRHAVTTRLGGVSQTPFASLNLSTGVGDSPEVVRENRHRLCHAVGVLPQHLVECRMVHGTEVTRVDLSDRGQRMPGVDALMTDATGVPLLLTYADRVPIILYDPVRHAVALIHAGWRGTVRGIAATVAQAMVETFGSKPEEMLAAIGPAIGPCCYPVGQEVIQSVRRAFPDTDALLPCPNGGQPHFDLWQANVQQLREARVSQVEVAGICTACHRDQFYSHRAESGRTGRFGVLLMLD